MEGLPPVRWADRYDVYGLALAAVAVALLLIVGVSVWVAIVLGAVITTVAAYLLRRRGGVPRMPLRRRRGRRADSG